MSSSNGPDVQVPLMEVICSPGNEAKLEEDQQEEDDTNTSEVLHMPNVSASAQLLDDTALVDNDYPEYNRVAPGTLDNTDVEMGNCVENDRVRGAELTDTMNDSDTSSGSGSGNHPLRACMAKLDTLQGSLDAFYLKHRKILKKVFYTVMLILYTIYFCVAVQMDPHRALPLIIITALVGCASLYTVTSRRYGHLVYKKLAKPIVSCLLRHWHVIRWLVYFGLVSAIVVFLVLEVGPRPKQFISMAGMVVFLLLLFVFSKYPSKVKFRPVIWGFGLQFLLAIIILRTSWGYAAFKFLGEEVHTFLGYTDAGVELVFGKKYKDHYFAFKVLPVIIFFSAVISTLYHLGIMQSVIGKLAWVMQKTMHTAATESLTAAGNIFIGQTEAPLLVRPFIADMTKSELHAMMTTGFATIAGGVLAAYILFGVPSEHLLCASVINAPGALAVSKLFYPETERSNPGTDSIVMEKGKERNVLEAASAGASASINLVANIAANLIAFLALLAFVDATMAWLGGMVGYPHFSFQVLCSYLFMPVAFLMGVEWRDCRIVARLLGIKTFVNEFVAYEELSVYIKNRAQCTLPYISKRSETIVTYALCGFANLSSIGIQLGGIGPMAPSRKGDIAELSLRALVAGITTCFITACIAGMLTPEEEMNQCYQGNSTFILTNSSGTDINSTLYYDLSL